MGLLNSLDVMGLTNMHTSLVVLNMILIWLNLFIRKDIIANWFIILMLFVSFIPGYNALCLSIFVIYVIAVPPEKYFFKRDNTLKELNKLYECNSCSVIFRKGYVQKEHVCPICNKESKFIEVENQKLYDKNIPEQQKITKSDLRKKKKLEKEPTEKQEFSKIQNERYVQARKDSLKEKAKQEEQPNKSE